MSDGVDKRRMTRFAFLLVNDFTLISMSSAVEPLRMANRISKKTVYRWKTLSETGAPVTASDGLSVNVDCSIDDASALADVDVLIVCGGWNIEANTTDTVVRWLRSLVGKGVGFGSDLYGQLRAGRSGAPGWLSVQRALGEHGTNGRSVPEGTRKPCGLHDRPRQTDVFRRHFAHRYDVAPYQARMRPGR